MTVNIKCNECGQEAPEDEFYVITVRLTLPSGEETSSTHEMCDSCASAYLLKSATDEDAQDVTFTIEDGDDVLLEVDDPSPEFLAAARHWIKS